MNYWSNLERTQRSYNSQSYNRGNSQSQQLDYIRGLKKQLITLHTNMKKAYNTEKQQYNQQKTKTKQTHNVFVKANDIFEKFKQKQKQNTLTEKTIREMIGKLQNYKQLNINNVAYTKRTWFGGRSVRNPKRPQKFGWK